MEEEGGHRGNEMICIPSSLFKLLEFILIIVSSFSWSPKEQKQSATGRPIP